MTAYRDNLLSKWINFGFHIVKFQSEWYNEQQIGGGIMESNPLPHDHGQLSGEIRLEMPRSETFETVSDLMKLMGDVPRIELFARRKTEGFDVWGNEVESDIEF